MVHRGLFTVYDIQIYAKSIKGKSPTTQDLSLGLWECVCVSPWGKVTWNGLVVFLRFHSVRLPSEWLHMNCFPSWCQLTEWMACTDHTDRVSVSLKVIKHFKWIIVSCSAMRKKPDWGRGTRSPAADPTRRRARRAAETKVHRRTEASSNEL